jgi:uridine kinase
LRGVKDSFGSRIARVSEQPDRGEAALAPKATLSRGHAHIQPKKLITTFSFFLLLPQKPISMLIIGIAGGTGSGKTTVVHQIMNELPETEVGIIHQDSYYRDNSNLSFEERALINFDHPRAIDFELLVSHLKQLKEGQAIEQPVYSFVTHNRTEDTVLTHPRKVMIVEGILILSSPELREMCDMKVFVHADSDERLIRRLRRDIAERGRDMEEVLLRYQTTLKPMHQQFIEPTKAFADIIIPNDKYNTVAIDVVRAVIKQRIA